MNTLFPLKLNELLAGAKKTRQWAVCNTSLFNKDLEIPDDGGERYPLFSPQIHYLYREYEFHRIRLVIYPEQRVKTTVIEIYSSDGKLLKYIPYRNWDFVTSLTIETELKGMILGSTES